MGEKFAANPVTGTGSMTVPIASSPGRSGFGPQLALSYDSGAGNGPYGVGWSLSLPSITRKTDNGLPKYEDADESDVFILSGAEDLVPAFKTDPITGEFVKDAKGNFVYDESPRDGYVVRRYRPRIEGLFARIERWTRLSDGDVYWRSISKDNITTFYGKTEESRIGNAQETSHIFTWLICQSCDDKGNAVIYEYAAENDDNVDRTQANERNRVRTANRYLKRIKYGNHTPNRDLSTWQATDPAQLPGDTWMFDVVFDYGEGRYAEAAPDADGRTFVQARIDPPAGSHWPVRQDPFSTYRAGFEVRTYRLCRRVMTFHHFPDELGTADYLVRSTEFSYSESPIASFVTEITQSGYVRQADGSYLKKSLPPLSFEYSKAEINDEIQTIDVESLQNLPIGVGGAYYQWLDLDGEGLQGVLAEQDEGWYYKRNRSPISAIEDNGKQKVVARFDPVIEVATEPFIAAGTAVHQFLDLAGDGNLDVVRFEKPMAGFFERTEHQRWGNFIPFRSAPNVLWQDPNLRFVDLTGDGHADILITEDDALTWYPSLGEEGFGPAERVHQSWDEERGPRLVFADGTQAIYLADISGDGLTDIVRIRNGEVCYWPNLGYGRFGAKVTMDNAPWFDAPDQFDQNRIRVADIDGSGTTDIIYLERNRVAVYRNECGNRWSPRECLESFPAVDDFSSVAAVDLLGNGTACLVWSSPLPGNARSPMRYIDLMSGQKPHLLIRTVNNLGAEIVIQYAPSTKFYLDDKQNGKPWITRLPFPVHVVERVETHDLISRNRFVSRYSYHHGYFDGIEREFRGFGRVEQLDTEELGALTESGNFPDATNIDAASYVPPVLTKTWSHTGAYIEGERISRHFEGEYYHEGDESKGVSGLTDEQLEAMLLPDTEVPRTLKRQDGSSIPWELTADEIRQACRALKGAVLRQEIYALDGSDDEDRPYTATEQNYTVELLQPEGEDRHAVFFAHPRESINFHYERKLIALAGKTMADPRVTHAMTLEVDVYGNALKSAAIGYGRRPSLSPLQGDDRNKQEEVHITFTENQVTNSINEADDYRTPLPAEARTYELIRIAPDANLPDITNLFAFDEIVIKAGQASDGKHDVPYQDIYTTGATANHPYRRLIERVRTLYRKDDLTALLNVGELGSRAIPGESYKLAFTPGLLEQVFQRNGQPLLANPAAVLGSQGADGGGYVDLDGDGEWWIPSGRIFYSPITNDLPAAELAFAYAHFFLPHRYRDPFHTSTVSTESLVIYDSYDLLMVETCDAIGNTVHAVSDYRVLAPRLAMDPNGNRSEVAFDALGLVVGTAAMGKSTETLGDLLDASFESELIQAELDAFMANPREASQNTEESVATQIVDDVLGKATTRIIYDRDRFKRLGEPPFAASIARETHVSDLQQGQRTKVQISVSYSDGFGREIQKKIQAEPGPAPKRDANGQIIVGSDGLPVMTGNDVSPRWVSSGWAVVNNKAKPVRKYEPFFTDTHRFEFEVKIGVSPIVFYDPAERVIAMLHPNHTFEKVVFDPWQQTTYDVNDTCAARNAQTGDPRTDPNIARYVAEYFKTQPAIWQTWHAQRIGGALGQDERDAALGAAAHSDTPTTAHFDALGRRFLTVARNRVVCTGHDLDGTEESLATRVELDIEGNQREVRDERKLPVNYLPTGAIEQRIVMRYAYDMLGNGIHQFSMEAGARWMLNDVAGKPIRAWDSRGHNFTTSYDALRRPLKQTVRGTTPESDPRTLNRDILVDKIEYGDALQNAAAFNLRTRIYRHFDSAGVTTNARLDASGDPTRAFDFKGNLLHSTRRLVSDYSAIPDWGLNPQLDDESFEGNTRYDALNRLIQAVAPHSSLGRGKFNVIQPLFNEANLLERMDVWLERDSEPVTLLDANNEDPSPVGVAKVDYDAKGQRLSIDYKNGASSFYSYDPLTFRLTQLLTRRNAITFPGDDPQPQIGGWPGRQVQNLHYNYDPAGNITHIQDDAQQTIYFKNKRVEPSNDYTYDAIYRLIASTGREHLGQVGGKPIPHSYNDTPRVGVLSGDGAGHFAPYDGRAMGRYIERYVYDAVGNFLQMQHRGSDPANPGWTRRYTYAEASLIEGGKHSNRLSRTKVGNGIASAPELYQHDAHGNMVRMPHLGGGLPSPNMNWDYKDQVRQTDLGGGGQAFYVYDGSGQRVRKVWEKAPGLTEERIYLGGFELFRKHNGPIGVNTATLERETLHIMDDRQRIALVEIRTLDTSGNDQAPTQLIRYQFSNHLGSACLELDGQAQIITYEEYTAVGNTSYQAVRSQTEAPKRYRYTGKERDEESGFYYHGARYYASWLARWVSCDPIGIGDGLNVYSYCQQNPVRKTDPSGTDGYDMPASRYNASKGEVEEFLCRSSGQSVDLEDCIPANKQSSGASLTGPVPPPPGSTMKKDPPHQAKKAPKSQPTPKEKAAPELSASELTALVEAMQPRLIYPKWITRAMGVGQTVGGVLELGAAIYTVETGVGPMLLGAHGLDTLQTGFRTALTGEQQKSVTFYAGSGAAFLFSNDPKLASAVGSSFDMAASLAAGAYSFKLAAPDISMATLESRAGTATNYSAMASDLSDVTSYRAEFLIGSQSNRARGPVLTSVTDTLTGEVFFGQNTGVPTNLHPILARRLALDQAVFGDVYLDFLGSAGGHSEMNALNEALWARTALTGQRAETMSDSLLNEFFYQNVFLRGQRQMAIVPRCFHCESLTGGMVTIGGSF